mmetsp:Transcript_38940/g.61611  ORF Transcript_38940/g.61611 Transcript_38940/m.61611 type:complete len:81 (+) Transcript_38940:163-405(+)
MLRRTWTHHFENPLRRNLLFLLHQGRFYLHYSKHMSLNPEMTERVPMRNQSGAAAANIERNYYSMACVICRCISGDTGAG